MPALRDLPNQLSQLWIRPDAQSILLSPHTQSLAFCQVAPISQTKILSCRLPVMTVLHLNPVFHCSITIQALSTQLSAHSCDTSFSETLAAHLSSSRVLAPTATTFSFSFVAYTALPLQKSAIYSFFRSSRKVGRGSDHKGKLCLRSAQIESAMPGQLDLVDLPCLSSSSASL